MTAPTHVAFISACYLGATAAFHYPIQAAHVLILGLSSLLPDVDYPQSWIGKVFYPVSSFLERKFGHRTITHSVVGCLIFAVLFSPVFLFVSREFYYLFLLGYTSHIVLDTWNKNGVPLLWPLDQYLFVIPYRRSWRIEVGSRGESIALIFFFIVSLGLYQAQGVGFYRLLHLATKDISYAREDFIKYSSSNFTTLRGKFRDNTTLEVKEAEYSIVATHKDGLIVLNDLHLKSVSKLDTANLYPLSAVLDVKEPMRSISTRVNLDGKSISDLISNIDSGLEHYIIGEAIPASRPPKIPDESDAYNPLYFSGSKIKFNYATAEVLEPFSNLLLKQGEAIIQYRLKPYEEPPKLNGANTPAAEIIETPLLISVTDLSRIRVKIGDEIKKGDVIADDPTIQNQIDIKYADQKNRESSFASQKANLIADIADLKITEGFPGHREKIRALEKELQLKEEAYDANKKKLEAEINLLMQKMRVESPVSGKVGSIRIMSFTGDKANVEMLIVSANPFPGSRVEVSTNGSTSLGFNISEVCTVVKVADGDTLDCKFGLTRTEKIRLIGVDTPETKHPKKPVQFYGKESARFTENVLSGRQIGVEYDVQKHDKYGRPLAYIYLEDGRMFNALLVQEGYAKVATFPPNVRYQKLFAELQREARESGKGLWGK